MKSICKLVIVCFVGALLAAPSSRAAPGARQGAPLHARNPYKKILKQWTRHGAAYQRDGLEARLDWDATYQDPEFRSARVDKLAQLFEWTSREREQRLREERGQADQYDEFFIGAYAGSSSFSGVGQDTGQWSLVLQVGEGEPVRPIKFEQTQITQVEKTLYPYLDRWDRAFWVRFPKVVRSGERVVLRMTGIPARSELVWK